MLIFRKVLLRVHFFQYKWLALYFNDSTQLYEEEEISADEVPARLAQLKNDFPDPDFGWQNGPAGNDFVFDRAAIPT